MAIIEVNWNPGRRELKQFAFLWIVFFGILGAIGMWVKHSPPAAVTFWIIATAGIVGCSAPRVMRPVYILWMALAMPIGWTVSHLLLLAVFYLVVTPIGLLMRLFGYDPLSRHFNPSSKSYWTPRDPAAESARYFKQY